MAKKTTPPQPEAAAPQQPDDLAIGRIRLADINEQMQQSYLSYAMSVIVSRALPDARDGLKPVQRRILYVMHDTGLRPDAPYRKSARIVGDVLGKYHPHGDQSVYDAMARMAQDFSMRYLLVDGQGNFGSVDGDPPAAMRYTEARLSRPAMELLGDLEKNTVRFNDNYDGTTQEPEVMPAALPNLILNGATGIAVGMATNIPPHNMGEIIDATMLMIERIASSRGASRRLQEGALPEADVDVDELMQFVKGPDFPTGGIVFRYDARVEGGDAIRTAYATGRGKLVVQAKAHIEEGTRGRSHIIVSELPYAVNKSALIERIAELVQDEKVVGITDIHDESDRRGMRIVIDINKNDDPRKVLAALYKYTNMRTSFGIIMLSLVNGEPRILSLKRMLQVFIEHRLIVIKRRSEFDLERARERAHILEGLVKALDTIDVIIKLIRTSRDTEAARLGLINKLGFSEVQAHAILDMPLRRLTQLDRNKLEEELNEKRKLIKSIEDLLKNPIKILGIIKRELASLRERFADPRRTAIVANETEAKAAPAASTPPKKGDKNAPLPPATKQPKRAAEDFPLTVHELLPSEQAYVVVGQNGRIGRTSAAPRPTAAAQVAPIAVVRCATRDLLYLIGSSGKGIVLQVGNLPQEDVTTGAGAQLHVISGLAEGDEIVGAFAIDTSKPHSASSSDGESGPFLICVTTSGMIKRSTISTLPRAPGQIFTAQIVGDDTCAVARLSQGAEDVLVFTQLGMAIRFTQESVRPMGLAAAGVVGIKLEKKDVVLAMDLIDPQKKDRSVVLGATDGRVKRVAFKEFPTQGRGGKGVLSTALRKGSTIADALVATPEDTIIYVTSKGGVKSLKAKNLTQRGRPAEGDETIALSSRERLVRVVRVED
ncbi:MAG: DNA topoisomerase 4 subunit A [Chloroflexi bacterium]|nr:DNA topoisomerase 4 subunit A [Chloroflexota bacterium]